MARLKGKLNLSLPKALIKEAKRRAITEDTTVSNVVEVLLKAWLAGRIDPPAP